uniref:NADH-ubiquinone oxidoreductase chain 2 n=1 Tax=Ornebius fuscicerci TaxID=2153492 RepID=A0A385I205_9ORTH|nr:NADH dehydrogenase subunit 2 [Ornebius fuscicerci]AXY63937.1 NADH dehydrogenase subunit 2 [Ornebius fuscicerci]
MSYNNPSKILFFSLLIMGTMVTISANSWLATWMGLEINLLSFIPLISNSTNMFSSEAALFYFLIQAVASSLLLFFMMIFLIMEKNLIEIQNIFYNLISITLFMKLGASPFHYWLPKVMEGLTWMNCLILTTWQKLAPFSILILLMKTSLWFNLISLTSIIVGAIGGVNQTSLRKIMAYSSINHIGWMILILQFNNSIWLVYFTTYSIMNFSLMFLFSSYQISHINQFMLDNLVNSKYTNFFISMNFLSLSGLPPFIGFLPKWLIIESMQMNLFTNFMLVILIISSILTLFYYLRISLKIFMFASLSNKWLILPPENINQNNYILMTLSFISILGLPCLVFLFNFL